ncbi:MAG: pitrilysin family protein [Sulfitobacter sp.]
MPASAMASDNEAVTYFTLDNGMEVVVVEDHRAPVVQQMVWYRAGSADEPKGSSGVAHFLEHLLFKATDKMESGEFSATVAANGGRDNAFTSYDYTAYHQRVAADRLELMMSMESDRMKNIRLTPENIETERDVILEERNQRTENSPGALFNEQLSAAQYLNHRYGTPVIGWKHEMEQLDLQDALAFYELYYSPNNAILVVSGDVLPEDVKALAEKYYGAIPANPNLPERLRTQEPPQTAERRLTFRDRRVAQPYVSRSYLAPERDPGAQEKAAALTMLSEILGGGTTSYLTEKLQFDTQIATYTGAFYRGGSLDDTTFDLVVVPAAGVSLQEAEDAMDAALAEFMKDGVDPVQLDRIKLQIRAEQIYGRDNAEGVANRYGRALAIGLTVQDVQEWPDVLEAVTEEDIMQAAAQVFDRRASVTGWLMKEEAAQ